jgi:uncharacterized protein YcbX
MWSFTCLTHMLLAGLKPAVRCVPTTVAENSGPQRGKLRGGSVLMCLRRLHENKILDLHVQLCKFITELYSS